MITHALRLTFQLHGPGDECLHEGIVGVTMQFGSMLSKDELLDLLVAEARKVLGDVSLDQSIIRHGG